MPALPFAYQHAVLARQPLFVWPAAVVMNSVDVAVLVKEKSLKDTHWQGVRTAANLDISVKIKGRLAVR